MNKYEKLEIKKYLLNTITTYQHGDLEYYDAVEVAKALNLKNPTSVVGTYHLSGMPMRLKILNSNQFVKIMVILEADLDTLIEHCETPIEELYQQSML